MSTEPRARGLRRHRDRNREHRAHGCLVLLVFALINRPEFFDPSPRTFVRRISAQRGARRVSARLGRTRGRGRRDWTRLLHLRCPACGMREVLRASGRRSCRSRCLPGHAEVDLRQPACPRARSRNQSPGSTKSVGCFAGWSYAAAWPTCGASTSRSSRHRRWRSHRPQDQHNTSLVTWTTAGAAASKSRAAPGMVV
jgi:hypothetical protein